MRLYGVAASLAALVKAADAATADEWRSRSIYQVMTDRYARPDNSTTAPCDTSKGVYCGGTWQGIINQLDYIQDMGFSAIWISPITANIQQVTSDLSSYHGYWQQSLYDLNDKFGVESDLQNLSKALHSRGMYLMVDIVANHMASASNYTDVQYSDLIPFNSSSYYHLPYCNVETPGTNQLDCWLGDEVVCLADLKTEDPDVQSIFNTWISTLVSLYNIDGLRLDSAGNIEAPFFTTFCESAEVFCMGEVYSGDASYVCPYQEAMDSTLNYPIYWPLTSAFSATNGSIQDLADEILLMQQSCKDPTVLGSFSENHDVPRFASHNEDMALAKNVLTYTMLADGVPIVYEGQEQHLNGYVNPLNREAIWLTGYNQSSPLYGLVKTLNTLRSKAIEVSSNYSTYQNWVIYNTSTTMATRKGYDGNQIIMVVNNDGSDGESRSFSLDPATSGFNPGKTITDVISCTNATTNGTGWLDVSIQGGLPQALYPAENLAGSTLCSSKTSPSNPSTTSGSPTSTSTHKKSAASYSYRGLSAVSYMFVSLVVAAAAQSIFL